MTATPDPVVVTSNLTYTLSITNYGPSDAVGVGVVDSLPVGSIYVSCTPSRGTAATNALGQLTWNLDKLTNGGVASLSLTVRPMILGPVTNSATVSAATLDVNSDNNKVTLVTTAASPTADLILNLAGSPNPVVAGSNLTYAVTVSNAGPATATAFSIRDAIPTGASFVSASSGGVYNGGVVTFDGLSLGSGAQLTVGFTVTASAVGTLSDTATCSMSVTNVVDPLKGNNTMTVKTTVLAPLVVTPPLPLLSIAPGVGNNVIITWPTQAGPYSIFYWTTNLLSPTSLWTPMNVSPVISGTNYTITVTNDSVEKFLIPGH
jgi:uncharacterized repeat protein (TIGR01451 family)